MDTPKRLNKYISETGFCSRREADTLISEGRVSVNGQVAEMGLKVTDADNILVDNKPLKSKPKRVYIAYNKPVGVTCTTERKIKSNIVNAINYPERIFPIGRLDRPSEGLIFLTNEGDIVNKILRAGNNHEKEYIVTVDKVIDDKFIHGMRSGVPILGTVTKKCFVKKTGPKKFTITLTQGLNRQIRRMCEYFGYEVQTLKRVRIMNVNLNGLRAGEWRHLSEKEMSEINASIEGSSKTEEASVDSKKRTRPKESLSQNRNSSEKPRSKNRDNQARSDKPKRRSGKKPERVKGTLSLKR
ncbi:23S rRNA pseudouridine(2604) synthase RluF [Pseudoalteromonas luteoviolacea]|uniref:Pseudouridine synthase n=1 Tax=Pseudoalteromonas luteoviolacea S4054 TaxID=1129367 RepID=A0A0F6A5Q6_9GAMM|nr:23S rRNA pseudouridine(2604) synthase RluF [Pseudoalteromonas luteoviolacea]AOT10559.1 23S rRNA pseudouridine synthase F [Pseudoalteromonas luteoviolacea]AOT15373.1 23S rRNA pseudouridine synthase F [Pseudoalteromonas luteoviolacea]AOT20378.1 23S rRNA pseudouridine synthase F [Pseudoalteromonas luteoviolacea]KKE81515.1 ribosomal RNA pseudouridine synthase [Pseudoalteromonas luteoviolacea S4054]KZN71588.1 ribosomal RNA pseudouridine synthase [Pseudoalteromonas luteoviolacea S4047-1]